QKTVPPPFCFASVLTADHSSVPGRWAGILSAVSIAASKSQAIRPLKQLIDIHKERNEQVNLKVSLVVEIYLKICQFHHQMSLAGRDQGAAGLGAVLLSHSSRPQVFLAVISLVVPT